MQQAAVILSQSSSSIEALFADYQSRAATKARAYALVEELERGEVADDTAGRDAEDACDAAYDALEAIADKILAAPVQSYFHSVIKANVLLARGSDPADLFHYRPEDLVRFVQEIRDLR